MWYVYVLLCSDGSLYTGSTSDPEKRFIQHSKGRGGRYTRTHLPVKRVYLETCTSRSEALKREFAIKQLTRQQKIKTLGFLPTLFWS